MEDETSMTSKVSVPVVQSISADLPTDSKIFQVSVRSWLAIVFTGTICAMSLMGKEVIEPLYGLGYLAIGFFFGQKTGKTI